MTTLWMGAHHTRYGIAKIDLARSHVQVAPRASKAISLVVAGAFRAAIRATTGLVTWYGRTSMKMHVVLLDLGQTTSSKSRRMVLLTLRSERVKYGAEPSF